MSGALPADRPRARAFHSATHYVPLHTSLRPPPPCCSVLNYGYVPVSNATGHVWTTVFPSGGKPVPWLSELVGPGTDLARVKWMNALGSNAATIGGTSK